MEAFKLVKTNNRSPYGYILFSTTFINPLDLITDVETKLLFKIYTGTVLIDLLATNENTNRYFSCLFDGCRLDKKSIVAVDLNFELKKVCAQFYKDSFKDVNLTVLSKNNLRKARIGIVI